MTVVFATIYGPAVISRAVQALAPHEGNVNTLVLRALEEPVTATLTRRSYRSGKYQRLAKALSLPAAVLNLSARPATALQRHNITYLYELVPKSPVNLFALSHFGEKSLREVKTKLTTLGLTLSVPLEDDAYRAAGVATVVATIRATEG